MDILLFGDQTADQYGLLRKVILQRGNSIVAAFVERAAAAIREETTKLSYSRRRLIPDFLHISNLLEAYNDRKVHVPELETAFITISQLAYYIGYFEDQPDELPNPTTARCVSLCTGSIAAVAVLSAKSLSDLVPLAVEAVRIAFRTGTCAGLAGDALAKDVDSAENWSIIVADTHEAIANAALDDFHNKAGIHTSAKAYISAISNTTVTVSGPPATTKCLFQESEVFRAKIRVPIAVYAPYHAPHLFGDDDIRLILNDQTRLVLQKYQPRGLIHSAATGKCLTSTGTLQLFQEVLHEMLCQPVRWNHLLEEVVSELKSLDCTQCRIFEIGSTNVIGSMVTAFKAGGQVNVVVQESSLWSGNRTVKSSRTQNDKIAIIGMAGRFPDAADHEKLWEVLIKGLDVHKEIPEDRFDAQAHCDSSGKGKNKSHTPYGCFLNEPGIFDPRFFNMSPREAAQTDPMARLALVTAYEALEMSGFVPNRTPSTKLHRIGTFYGQTSDDWREVNAAENIDTYFITGGVRAFAPGRINYYFKFEGPSFSIDTACSSSLTAIQLACTSLWAGDCDTACAGGLNVLTNPDIFAGLSKGQFLSKTGSCKTFDNDADGYCRGDGCGTIILKRYQDAIDDKDNILGCILSCGTNHSANAVSITHPHAGAQEFLYKKILADAGVDAHEINYVEMHGTGTQAGDGIEMTSVTNVFAPTHRRRRLDQPLYLGAIKANIGHGEAASGINSMIKCLLMLREGQIPPNVGIKGLINQSFPKDLVERNVHIPVKSVQLPRNATARRKIFLNNFSAAGGNTAVLLEDGPTRKEPLTRDSRSHHLITVTARAISSLKKNIGNLVKHIDSHSSITLPSLSYTLTARRIQHNYRVAFSVSNMSQVRPNLLKHINDNHTPTTTAPTHTIFVFTGQGTQYPMLGQKLYEELAPFRSEIDQLDKIVQSQGMLSFLPLIRSSDISSLSPVIIQLGLVCIQVALARIWISWGVEPAAVVGHSLGEYAALHIAGVISATDMVRLVGHRAWLLAIKCTKGTHGMLAVKGNAEAITKTLGGDMLEVACRNSPEETVLCGTMRMINTANDTLVESGFKTTILKVPFAFHSAQVDPILEPFQSFAQSVTFIKPSIPLMSPLTGTVVRGDHIIGPEYLARHAREPVDFQTAILKGMAEKIFTEKTAWLEIGAHPVCSNMIRNTTKYPLIIASSLRRDEDPWKTITTSICTLYSAGVYVNFDEYHRGFNDAHELLMLPTYSFDNKTYWLDYHNKWCLTKGEDPIRVQGVESAVEPPSKLSTTSCQRIIREEFQENFGTLVVQSDITVPKLFAAICGHMVNGAALCPSSLYADMALTISDYIFKELRPNSPHAGLNVCNMEVYKPLIAQIPPRPGGQFIQVEAIADLKAGEARLKYQSVTPEGKTILEHARCTVKFEDVSSWVHNWSMRSFMVQNQIDNLKQKLQTGAAHKILRGMAYKLFQALVSYNENYRGMEEVILDGKDFEATALVSFQTGEQDGNFFCSPYWIDSLCHISGFIVNATDLVDSSEHVFISHGWDSMRFSRPFTADKKYRSYVRMQPQANNVRAGDVYICDGDEIVGVVGRVKFQEIPRRLLNTFLPPVSLSGKDAVSSPNGHSTFALPALADRLLPRESHHPPDPTRKSARSIPSQTGPALISRIMDIIAKETDVDMSELADEAAFENLGVDSLMSLTISAEFRECLDLDIPSTLFSDCPTVGEIKKFFLQYDSAASSTAEDTSGSSRSSNDASLSKEGVASQTPLSGPSEAGDESIYDDLHEPLSIENEEGKAAFDPSMTALRKAAARDLSASPDSSAFDVMLSETVIDASSGPRAKSMLLQGNPKTAIMSLFLFPDGSGSATSYLHIPPLSPSVAVFGLNCPFMKNPHDFVLDFHQVCALYMQEMRRRQPSGPYFVGGWSAGGVVAYEVTAQLVAMGERVEKLFLIDSPCPVALAPLPSSLFRFLEQIGLLGSKGAGSSPDWLVPHFEATVRTLASYKPAPILGAMAPDTVMIWAKDGVCGKFGQQRRPPVTGKEPKTMRWLLDDRTDFEDNGWAQLLEKSGMKFRSMGGNHFTMMTDEHAATLGRLIREGLGIDI